MDACDGMGTASAARSGQTWSAPRNQVACRPVRCSNIGNLTLLMSPRRAYATARDVNAGVPPSRTLTVRWARPTNGPFTAPKPWHPVSEAGRAGRPANRIHRRKAGIEGSMPVSCRSATSRFDPDLPTGLLRSSLTASHRSWLFRFYEAAVRRNIATASTCSVRMAKLLVKTTLSIVAAEQARSSTPPVVWQCGSVCLTPQRLPRRCPGRRLGIQPQVSQDSSRSPRVEEGQRVQVFTARADLCSGLHGVSKTPMLRHDPDRRLGRDACATPWPVQTELRR